MRFHNVLSELWRLRLSAVKGNLFRLFIGVVVLVGVGACGDKGCSPGSSDVTPHDPPPHIDSIFPNSGNIGTTVDVVISGSNFFNNVSVKELTAGNITILDTNAKQTEADARLTINANASLGEHNFVVHANGADSNPLPFTVLPIGQIPQPIPGIVHFLDTVFNDTDWKDVKVSDTTAANDAAFSVKQITSGGNPQEYRATTNTWTGGNPSLGLVVRHLKNNAVYNLFVTGPIDTIDWSWDDKVIMQNHTNGVASYPLILQNGKEYIHYNLTGATVWTTHTLTGLTSADFSQLSDNSHPDFSSTGGPIQFGYGSSNSSDQAVAFTVTSGIDNWDVKIHYRGRAAQPLRK